MSIIIDPLHLQHFKNHHEIEFENFFSNSNIELIKSKFKKRVKDSAYQKPYPLKAGFDLWRDYTEVKKVICSIKIAKMAGQLIGKTKLRFAFSQYLDSDCFCNEFAFLKRKSCIQELICGLCICLEPSKEPENPFFSTEKGNAIFFEIEEEDFYLRFPKTDGKYLFVFFANKNSCFTHQVQDPLNSFFRELGYEQGDRLKETLNPSFSWMPV